MRESVVSLTETREQLEKFYPGYNFWENFTKKLNDYFAVQPAAPVPPAEAITERLSRLEAKVEEIHKRTFYLPVIEDAGEFRSPQGALPLDLSEVRDFLASWDLFPAKELGPEPTANVIRLLTLTYSAALGTNAAIEQAKAEEREACAKLADAELYNLVGAGTYSYTRVAAAIRAR